MKIVFLLTQDLESPSGLGRYAPFARQLGNLGHKVTIFALHPDFQSSSSKNQSNDNLHVTYVAPMHVRKKGSLKTYYTPFELVVIVLQSTWALTKAALSERPDLIWIGKPHPMNGIAGIIAKLRWGCRLFLDCDDDEAGSGNFPSSFQRAIVTLFENRLPILADLITTNTHYTYEKMAARGISRQKIYYLPNGIDTERFTISISSDHVNDLKVRMKLAGKKIISYIGSMSLTNHAVDLLIDAFEIVYHQDHETRLMLVGGGEDYDVLCHKVTQQCLDNKVVFIGKVPPDQIASYYQISDVTVDPVYDNIAAKGRSPLKMLEAWMCGVPFVTSPVGDRVDLIGDPPAALLCTPGDPEQLALALQTLLKTPGLRHDLILNGHRRLAQFAWEYLARQVNSDLLY